MITNEMINSLTDEEILVFYLALKYTKNLKIGQKTGIKPGKITYLMNRIYFKLDIRPRSRAKLRQDWRLSCLVEEYLKKKGHSS